MNDVVDIFARKKTEKLLCLDFVKINVIKNINS